MSKIHVDFIRGKEVESSHQVKVLVTNANGKTLLSTQNDNELFLNDKVFAIRRSDLQLDCIGCIHGIKPNRLTLRKTTGSMVHLQTGQYHILFKRKRSKQNDREFYQALLNSL